MSSHKLVEKDVQATLMKTRKCRRPKGVLAYPAEYSRAMMDYDHWNHLLIADCCGSLTMHQFDEPPAMVLDLGCGSGFWAIEAAKRWPNAIITGYDTLAIQPKLHRNPKLRRLARRITWVKGNLLDGLPFVPNTFDFVRIAGLGLGIPEDEWQLVLEDVRRVLKIGGAIEVIEEDLIFPCGVPPEERTKPVSVPINVELAPDSPATSMFNKSSDVLPQPWSRGVDDALLASPGVNASSSTASTKSRNKSSEALLQPWSPSFEASSSTASARSRDKSSEALLQPWSPSLNASSSTVSKKLRNKLSNAFLRPWSPGFNASSSTASAGSRSKNSDALLQPWSPSFDNTRLMSPSVNGSTSTVSANPKSRFSSDSSAQSCLTITSRPSTPDPIIASQDHTNLKTAWEAMLAHHFLATNLLNVLPFYLCATFVNVKTHPAIKIPLPPNSLFEKEKVSGEVKPPQVSEPSPANDRPRGSTSPFALRPIAECWLATPFDSTQQTIPSWSIMHLSKAVETARGCKESLWREYERLGLAEDLPPVTRTTRAEDVLALSSPAEPRESFELDWENWERDMADRVGMRTALTTRYGWTQPPGEKPKWLVWRKAIDDAASSTSLEGYAAIASPDDDETQICRAIKCFVGWKGPPEESETE